MSELLHKGMTLYHKTNRTPAVIIELDDKNIKIELSNEIAGEKELMLPITHMGEWLFYKEHEIDFPLDILATMSKYWACRNKKILKLCNEGNEDEESLGNNELSKIRQIVDARGIKDLVHFTRVENLASILKYGLVPVSLHEKMRIASIRNDERRIDSRLDCTSCSITFPNYRLFYRFRQSSEPRNWVVLVLDTDVLFSPDNKVYFCGTNAAGLLPRISNPEELRTALSFEEMFRDRVITNEEHRIIPRVALGIDDNYTTDPQAELLISGIIDSAYIKRIAFEEDVHITACEKDYGTTLDMSWCGVCPEFFAPRQDYGHWR